MAPSLWGPSLTSVCSDCGQNWMIAQETFNEAVPLTCPCCGSTGQIMGKSPGQKVLAKKSLPDQPIDRWQCVVFGGKELFDNQTMPSRQTRFQVKRVLGLPGEQVAFSDGELWINNHKLQKNLHQMRLVAVPVSTFPSDSRSDWYQFAHSSTCQEPIAIEQLNLENEHANDRPSASDPQVSKSSRKLFRQKDQLRLCGPRRIQWRHRNWLNVSKQAVRPPEGKYPHSLEGIESSNRTRQLSEGADGKMGADQSSGFSQTASLPVLDDYWMNHSTAMNLAPVHDLLLTIQLRANSCQTNKNHLSDNQVATKATVLQLQCNYFGRLYAVELELRDLAPISAQPLGAGQTRLEYSDKSLQTVSIGGWDGKVWLQCNGHPPIELQPTLESATETEFDDDVTTFAIELLSGSVNIDQMTILRDLYLRVDQRDVCNGVQAPVTLTKNQYYVVGDNLPISIDSRNELGLIERSQISAVVVSTDQNICKER